MQGHWLSGTHVWFVERLSSTVPAGEDVPGLACPDPLPLPGHPHSHSYTRCLLSELWVAPALLVSSTTVAPGCVPPLRPNVVHPSGPTLSRLAQPHSNPCGHCCPMGLLGFSGVLNSWSCVVLGRLRVLRWGLSRVLSKAGSWQRLVTLGPGLYSGFPRRV